MTPYGATQTTYDLLPVLVGTARCGRTIQELFIKASYIQSERLQRHAG